MGSERPSFPDIYMSLARSLASRSTCVVGQVGTVITSVDFRQVLAVGYTGNATGLPNRCDQEGPDCGCLHAEENAIIHCEAPRADPKIVFSTKFPCRACAKRLINLGGVQDLYAAETGSQATTDLLGSVGIRVYVL
jgi:dCMP deaminase